MVGRSSSAAKKAEAVFRISLARRSSAFSRLSLLISALTSLVVVNSLPVSSAALLHQRVRVLAEMPSLLAVSLMARVMEGASWSWSLVLSMRMARCLNSGGYFVGMFFIIPSLVCGWKV